MTYIAGKFQKQTVGDLLLFGQVTSKISKLNGHNNNLIVDKVVLWWFKLYHLIIYSPCDSVNFSGSHERSFTGPTMTWKSNQHVEWTERKEKVKKKGGKKSDTRRAPCKCFSFQIKRVLRDLLSRDPMFSWKACQRIATMQSLILIHVNLAFKGQIQRGP